MHVVNKFARIHSLDEALKFAIVRVRGVRHLKVEGQVLVVFVVPAGKDDEDGWLLSIALVYATRIRQGEKFGGTSFYRSIKVRGEAVLTHGLSNL